MTTAIRTERLSPGQPEEVLVLLREQVSLYNELAGYAVEQRALIAEEDTGPLLSVLGKRQQLSGRLSGMVERLEPIRRDWDRHRERFDATQRQEAERLLVEIRVRLRELIERDEEDVKLLSTRKKAAAAAMESTNSTHQALSAYRTPDVQSRRLDQMSEGA